MILSVVPVIPVPPVDEDAPTGGVAVEGVEVAAQAITRRRERTAILCRTLSTAGQTHFFDVDQPAPVALGALSHVGHQGDVAVTEKLLHLGDLQRPFGDAAVVTIEPLPLGAGRRWGLVGRVVTPALSRALPRRSPPSVSGFSHLEESRLRQRRPGSPSLPVRRSGCLETHPVDPVVDVIGHIEAARAI